MKTFGIIIAIIGGVIGLSIAGMFIRAIFFPLHTAGNLINAAYNVSDKTLDADNIIYNYEWFKQQYEDIQAINKKVSNATESIIQFEDSAGERINWTFEDKNEYTRLKSIELGLKNQLEDMIAKYNARSNMANRNIFKDGLIPNTLEIGSSFLK